MSDNQPFGTSSVSLNLSEADKQLIKNVEDKLKADENKLKVFCDFVCQRVGDKCAVDFVTFSPEVKFRACLDYIVIGLVSGSIKSHEIQKMLEE